MALYFLSLFSGVEAASLAWEPLGFKPLAFAECEPFPSAVLADHWPSVPNLGDVTTADWSAYRGTVDILVGGSPCQSFSVAGLRKGLADPRGNLALEFLRAVDRARPRYVVWENVPGVLSSNGGRDFGAFLGALGKLGYGFAYRVLDAQHFGVPQRRRRLFVVGYLGAWQRAAAVLFERESLLGNRRPRRAPRPSPTDPSGGRPPASLLADGDTVTALTRGLGSGGPDAAHAQAGWLVAEPAALAFKPSHYTRGKDGAPSETCPPLMVEADRGDQDVLVFEALYARNGRGAPSAVAPCLKAQAGETGKGDAAPIVLASGQAHAEIGRDLCPALSARQYKDPPILAPLPFDETQITHRENRSNPQPGDPSPTLAKGARPPAIAAAEHVRRLTPRECERLQGMPDDHTLIPWRGKAASECPDGPRYKAIGNSMAVPVMRWLGERIMAAESST